MARNKESLLDKARSAPVRKARRVEMLSDDEVDVIMAWIKEQITTSQAGSVIGYTDSSAGYQRLAQLLVKAIRAGQIEVSRNGK